MLLSQRGIKKWDESSQKRIIVSRPWDGDRRKGFGGKVILNLSISLFCAVEQDPMTCIMPSLPIWHCCEYLLLFFLNPWNGPSSLWLWPTHTFLPSSWKLFPRIFTWLTAMCPSGFIFYQITQFPPLLWYPPQVDLFVLPTRNQKAFGCEPETNLRAKLDDILRFF